MVDDPLVLAEGLTKRFGELEAVAGSAVEVRRGEAFGFLGLNSAASRPPCAWSRACRRAPAAR